jgi:hypothetical protein
VTLRSVNPGFDGSNVLTLHMSVDSQELQASKELQNLWRNGTETAPVARGRRPTEVRTG